MMEEYYIGNVIIDKMKLDYYICGNRFMNPYTGFYEWGIKIVKNENEATEEITVENISSVFVKVKEITEILMRNSVTPCGLTYALENILT